LALYLNALAGKGAHLVTVNEYLASYHAGLMGEIYEFLCMTTGCILQGQDNKTRRAQYICDITYSTNNELGFDYLRDNSFAVTQETRVQRPLHFAIIDEVDSILIDEARTPLIISSPSGKSNDLYKVADRFAKNLKKGRILNEEALNNPTMRAQVEEEGDFVVDEKKKTVTLTQEGLMKAERFYGVSNFSDPENVDLVHYTNNALMANYNKHLDVDYIIKEDEIIIVDEFTGRLMPGRRFNDGLHQSIEAKEGVKVQRESKTAATITFQNFFNKYYKKAGMTGTALTEEGEFRDIYKLDVVSIPTNKPMIRIDKPDVVYRTEGAKFCAIIDAIEDNYNRRQPVLVGTVSIEKSELVSQLLKRRGIPHEVLNAKQHEREADIIAMAGQAGRITIATNMAGRGTDIFLGEGVRELGGLNIIGTDRHESRRIDNQLRGRAGRQGDPGQSQFYISLEGDLMRLFGGERITRIMDAIGFKDDDALEHKMLSGAVENAQKKVESNNFGIRKHVLQYDQVMNEQREIIYGERNKIIDGIDLRDNVMNMLRGVLDRAADRYASGATEPEEWDLGGLSKELLVIFHKETARYTRDELETLTPARIKDDLYAAAAEYYTTRETAITPDRMREIERIVMMQAIDRRWMDHIDEMDQMRHSISLRSYAQRDPLVEYKFLSYEMFEEMTNNIQLDTIRMLFNVQITNHQQLEMKQVVKNEELSTNASDGPPAAKTAKRAQDKVGRNDPCPCGSGKKFKQCCVNK
jgi:preprotein translocase subunit SecA